jgi:hypothetical protein
MAENIWKSHFFAAGFPTGRRNSFEKPKSGEMAPQI